MKDEEAGSHSSKFASVTAGRSEFDFLRELRRRALNENPSLTTSIGDDAAVIAQNSGRDTVITTDLLVENIDFFRHSIEPALLGHKALAVSLSDIAAMGARPLWALVSLGLPEDVWDSGFANDFYEGLFKLASDYDVRLIGGDTSRTPEHIVVDSILMGECTTGKAVLRSNAQPGDRLFVTGTLGGSASGLSLIEHGARFKKFDQEEDHNVVQDLLMRHLKPEPRVGWGIVLGEEGLASSMIDLSDGLSSDIHHLCEESKVGALVRSGDLPIDPNVIKICGRRRLDPLMLALHGGEDFELLFTVPRDKVGRLPRRVDGIGVTEIGEIRPTEEGVRISEGSHVWNLEPGGWKHF